MTPERTTTDNSFSHTEMHSLRSLRKQYLQDLDLFSDRERSYLQFIRWQYETGSLAS